MFSDRSENKEKPDSEVRSSGEDVHDRHASPSMMAIQGENQECRAGVAIGGSTEIERAGAAGTGTLHDMEVDHRGVDIGMSEEVLDRADVGAGFE